MNRYGVVAVRGCEVWEVRDEDNVVINEMGGKPDTRPGGRMDRIGTKTKIGRPAKQRGNRQQRNLRTSLYRR